MSEQNENNSKPKTTIESSLLHTPRRWTRRDIVVLKFGGTTVGATQDEGRIRIARETIAGLIEDRKYVVPVFSAFRRGRSQSADKISMTDILQSFGERIHNARDFEAEFDKFKKQVRDIHFRLIIELGLMDDDRLAEKVERELELINSTALVCCRAFENVPSLNDTIITGGERLAVTILAGYLSKKHQEGKFPMPCEPVTGLELGIYTDDNFGSANILWNRAVENSREVIFGKYLEQGIIPIVSGFDGVHDPQDNFKPILQSPRGTDLARLNHKFYRTSLGRGGSDLTATFLGMALDAEYVGFCKETCGVLTADDKLVGDAARTIETLNYELATEAGNIYSRAVEPVRASGVPVHIFDPSRPEKRSIISDCHLNEGIYIVERPVKTVNIRVGSIPDEPGSLNEFLGVFAKHGVNVEEVYHQRSGTDCIIDGSNKDIDAALESLKSNGLNVVSQFSWYIRAVGNISEQLVNEFNQFMSWYEPLSLSTFQVGSNVLTATIARNRAGDQDEEVKRVEEIILELHDQLICQKFEVVTS